MLFSIEFPSLFPYFLLLFPQVHFALPETPGYFYFVRKLVHGFVKDEVEFFGSKEEEEIHALEYSSLRFGYFG